MTTGGRGDSGQDDLDAGLAAIEEGDLAAATAAFERVLEADPTNVDAAVHLAHVCHAAGEPRRAVELLDRAAAADDAGPEVLRALLTFAERAGDTARALAGATRLLALDPGDVGAALAVADLHIAEGDLDAAAKDFLVLRSIDDDEGHEVYNQHGRAEALLRAERWRAALDAAIEATRLDRMQLTTDVLRFATVKLFGETGRTAPLWSEVATALAAQRAAHRRLHAEEGVL